MYKQIRFVIKNIIRIILTFLISLLTIRDKNIIVMGLRTPITKLSKVSKDYFMHNTKYMFLKLSKTCEKFKFIYLCDDKEMVKALYKAGFENIYPRKSLKGLYYTLRAKYWLYDDSKFDVNTPFLSGGAICINLWHGAGGLKKIGFEMNKNFIKLNSILQKIQIALTEKDNIYVVNSKYEAECRKSAFKIDDKKIKILSSPRIDVLYNDIPNSDIFMEEDYETIKNYKEQGKKIFIYTPTFRDTGKDLSSWLQSDKLTKFLIDNNAILVCKLHFADNNSLNFELTKEFYKMNNNSDIYPVLKYSDALITDYSSIYFDYLHLNKPIIYHIPDLEEYETQCRGFYRPYETLTSGEFTRTNEGIISAMQNIINCNDKYIQKRNALLDEMFVYKDGKNCERVIEWIKSLDK